MLDTPQALESQLPGEGHLYRWAKGHLFYKVLGAPGAPPLVLLHSPGMAASAHEMRGMMQPLAQRFRVYAPDLPGFGLSDRPGVQYTSEFYVQICHEFLEKVVQQPAILVASKLSCNYAVALAASAPELCSGLALISPLALRGKQITPFPLRAAFELGPVKMLLYPLLVWASQIVARDPYYHATTHRFGAEHAAMALLAGRLTPDVSRELEQVRQPTLVIWGADALGRLQRARFNQNDQPDPLGPARAHIELLPDGDLALHEEQPQRVAKAILQWSENSVELPASPTVEAYCMKCKTKRPIVNAREVTIKNGRIAVQGECAVCGTQIFRMGRLAPGYPQTPV
jgi:pimeloyl-ACP methyl ester carboxylesterase